MIKFDFFLFSVIEQLIGVANYEKHVWFKTVPIVVIGIGRRLGAGGDSSSLPASTSGNWRKKC